MQFRHTRRSVLVTGVAVVALAAGGTALAVTRGHDNASRTAAATGQEPGTALEADATATATPSAGAAAKSPTRPAKRPTKHPKPTPSPTPTATSTTTTTPQPTQTTQPTAEPTWSPTGPAQGNPLAMTGGLYVDPQSEPAYWVSSHPTDSRRTAIKNGIADVPMARWYNGNSEDASDARSYVAAADAANKLPALVAYNIPGRGCGGGEGAGSADAYRAWVDGLAAAIGSRPAVVVLEPDALPQLGCLSSTAQSTRLALLGYAVDRFAAAAPNTWTYLDAGHDAWTPAATMAARLKAAHVANARGFSLNVSNYQSTARNVSYAQAVDASLGMSKAFVIDVSRNGRPLEGDDWCNPSGELIGPAPRAGGATGLDLQLWVKPPGESDGDCGIGAGTYAGEFVPSIAMKLLGY
ncbi:MAG TPA: glycoside hydrolase family 6 protein [Kribbellaceae bacterium]|nr:glycoside hydrolase family 6 protein [Kribbellaceae bacterium]